MSLTGYTTLSLARVSGEPSVPLPEDELSSSKHVTVFSRRRDMRKPFFRHLEYRDPSGGAGGEGGGVGDTEV